ASRRSGGPSTSTASPYPTTSSASAYRTSYATSSTSRPAPSPARASGTDPTTVPRARSAPARSGTTARRATPPASRDPSAASTSTSTGASNASRGPVARTRPSTRLNRYDRGAPRSRSKPTRYQPPRRAAIRHGCTRRDRTSPVLAARYVNDTARRAEIASINVPYASPTGRTRGARPATTSIAVSPAPAARSFVNAREMSVRNVLSCQNCAASASTPSSAGVRSTAGSAYASWSIRYPASSACPPASTVTIGIPSSRNVSLSRSNIRSNASGDGASPYPATLARICCFVIDAFVFTNAITRFSRRAAGFVGDPADAGTSDDDDDEDEGEGADIGHHASRSIGCAA